ncbi:DUF4014 domain-containing protein [Salmonella enterica subsp. enterica serovar Heidelberg]|nr:DUF4014 domain-containing protein [Salmonella enterica subsp. enterica serovar Heidelberg]
MTTLFRKNYPRKSRVVEILFFILFIVLMTPISPLLRIRLTELLASHCTKLCHSTITPPCQRR